MVNSQPIKKNKHCQLPRKQSSGYHYNADDKNEEGPTSSSSLSTMSSVSSPVHANNTFIGHPHLDDTRILAGQPYFGSLLGMDKEEELEAAEAEGQEKDNKSPTLETSYPVGDAFANLPPLSPLLAALVELYQILKKSSAPLWLFDELISFYEKNSRTLQKQKNIPSRKALLCTLNSLFPVPKAEGIPLAMKTGNGELAPEGYQHFPQQTIS
jgi:hypothetical protein